MAILNCIYVYAQMTRKQIQIVSNCLNTTHTLDVDSRQGDDKGKPESHILPSHEHRCFKKLAFKNRNRATFLILSDLRYSR